VGSREAVSWAICGAIGVVLIGFALFGGGSGRSGHTPGTEVSADQARTEIGSVISRFFTVADPTECTEDVTPALLRQNFGGSDPLEICRRVNTSDAASTSDAGLAPHSVQVNEVSVRGTTADASVKVAGGYIDGSEVSVDLIEDRGRWKIDHLVVSRLDRGGFDRVVLRSMTREGATPSEAGCVVAREHRAISDQELASKLLNASSYGGLSSVGLACLSRATLLAQLEKVFAQEMQSRGLPTAIGECAADRFVQGMSDAQLRAFIAAPHETAAQHARALEIGRACAQDYANGVLPRNQSS
jgi:hypothetical protein